MPYNYTVSTFNFTEALQDAVYAGNMITGGSVIIDDKLSVAGEITASGAISSSNSITASAFKGDGSGLTNVAAGSIAYTSITGAPSQSLASRVTNLKTNSGSFSTRVTNLKTDSGSFSTRVSANESLLNQSVKSDASPTFVGSTVSTSTFGTSVISLVSPVFASTLGASPTCPMPSSIT